MRARPADILFGVSVLFGSLVLVWAGSGLTFFYDEWLLVLDPDPLSLSTLVANHNGQFFLLPHLIYGIGLEAFGMGSQLPFRLVTVVATLVCLTLLYVLLRRLVSPWLALVLILPLVALGTAWESLLLGLSMNFQIGLAAGLGMLVALEKASPGRDLLASVLLFVSLTCGGIGAAFLAGALVDVAIRRDPRRLWVPLVPFGVFAVGYVLQGAGQSGIDLAANLANLPAYLWDALRAGVEAVTGLKDQSFIGWGGDALVTLLCLLLIAASIWRLVFAKLPLPRNFLVIGSILLAFWILGGIAMSEGRAPEASRYQFPASVLLIGYTASLLVGLRVPRWLPLALLPLALLALSANLYALKGGHDFLSEQTEITRAAIGQVEAEGPGPSYNLTEETTGSSFQRLIESNAYLDAVTRFGSPAFRPDEIKASGPAGRQAAAGVEMAAAIARESARN